MTARSWRYCGSGERSDALLQGVDGEVVAEHVVAHLGARHGGAQGGGQRHRVGVFQVDHMDVAAGFVRAGLVQLRHQGAHQRQPRRVGCAQHQAVAARLGQQRGFVSGVCLRATAAARAGFDEPVHQRHHVAGQRVLQRNHLHIGGPGHVQRGDDAAQALQVVGVVGDDQRVVAGVDVDGVVRPDERAQHRHQVVGRLVVEPENLCHHLVGGGQCRHGSGVDHRALQLGVGLGHDFVQPAGVHQRKALQPQHGGKLVECRRRRHRAFGGEVDGAFDTRVHHHVAPADGGHGAGHSFNFGPHKVEHHRFAGAPGGLGVQRCQGQAQAQAKAQGQGAVGWATAQEVVRVHVGILSGGWAHGGGVFWGWGR